MVEASEFTKPSPRLESLRLAKSERLTAAISRRQVLAQLKRLTEERKVLGQWPEHREDNGVYFNYVPSAGQTHRLDFVRQPQPNIPLTP